MCIIFYFAPPYTVSELLENGRVGNGSAQVAPSKTIHEQSPKFTDICVCVPQKVRTRRMMSLLAIRSPFGSSMLSMDKCGAPFLRSSLNEAVSSIACTIQYCARFSEVYMARVSCIFYAWKQRRSMSLWSATRWKTYVPVRVTSKSHAIQDMIFKVCLHVWALPLSSWVDYLWTDTIFNVKTWGLYV